MPITPNHQNAMTRVWIFFLCIVPFIFDSTIYEGSHLPKLFCTQIAILIILILSLFDTERVFASNLIFIPLFLFLFLHIISIFWATNPTETVLQLAFYVPLLLLPIIVSAALSQEQFYRVITLAPWAGLPIALLGISQYFGLEILSIPSNAQPSATFFHRNAAAAYTICVLPFAWVKFQNAQTRNQSISQAILIILLSIFLVFTRTRAAWIAIVGAIIIVAGLSLYASSNIQDTFKKLKRGLLSLICVCIVIATFLPDNIQSNKRANFDEKKESVATAVTSIVTSEGHRGRIGLWKNTLSMILNNPLGVGLGNWQIWYPFYAKGDHVNVNAAPERPHNDLLWITSELGVLGLLLFLVLCLVAIRALIPFHQTDPQKRSLAQGLLSIILAYVIDGFFSFPRGQVVPSLFFYLALGGSVLLSPQSPVKPFAYKRATVLVMFLLVLASMVIAFKRIQYDQHHHKVHIAERQHDWPTVIAEANLAKQVGTYRANTFIALGRAYYHTDNLNEAENAYKTGISLHPNSLNAYNNLGIVYRQLGKNELAVEAFKKALYLYPNFVEAYYNLGNTYVNQQHWPEALQAYQNAEKRGLDIPQLFFKLGQVSYALKDLEQARHYFHKALKQEPNFRPAIQALQILNTTQTPQ